MKHTFFPGDGWLYFKIYCGQSYANSLLINHLYELANSLTNDKWISKWFFIRYEDPDFHIRFRIEIIDKDCTSNIIEKVNRKLEKDILIGRVWKVQMEPYQREIQRYGAANIELMEKLFWIDSIFVCKVLTMFGDNERSKIFMSVLNMDLMLDRLGMNFEKKKELVQSFHSGFKKEYSLELIHKKKLNKYFRNNFITNFKEFAALKEVKKLTNTKFEECEISVSSLNGEAKILNNVYFGLNHMYCNRMFSYHQRVYEMICYDFLSMQHKFLTHKAKSV